MGAVAGDFNEDGVFDFVTENDGRSTDDMQVWIGNGDGTIQSPQTITRADPSQGPRGLDVGDVDRDGNLDLVQGRYSSCCKWYWFAGNGDGTFDAQALGGTQTPCNNDDAYALALGDFNDDLWPDAVIGNAYYGYDNTAHNIFSGAASGFTRVGTFPYTSTVGSFSNVHGWMKGVDVDHDGHDDLVGHFYCDNSSFAGVYLWLRDPSAPFAFHDAIYIGNPGSHWMGQGTASPARDHNLHYSVALSPPEGF
jgi:FG-GAP-like repeat